MIQTNKPHIRDLAARLRLWPSPTPRITARHTTPMTTALESELTKNFLLRAREFQAGIGLIDDMIKHDRFQSTRQSAASKRRAGCVPGDAAGRWISFERTRD